MRILQEEMMKSEKGGSVFESQPLYGRKKMVSKFMKERFPERIHNLLMEFGRVGDELGYSVHAVGGFVRDLLLRVENYDVDIVVEGDGIRLAEEFEKKFPCRIRTHKKFGTAIILFPDGLKVDVATARIEVYDSPAALPPVDSGSVTMGRPSRPPPCGRTPPGSSGPSVLNRGWDFRSENIPSIC